MPFDYETALKKVTSWLLGVGKLQLEGLKADLNIRSKSNEYDLVTEIDQRSEQLLVSAIQREYPDHSILSEEAGAIENKSDYVWVIDPLDGTVNYAHRFPIFCISVALQFRKETLLGAVYVPVLGELFTALKGQGAFLNHALIHVSPITQLGQSLLATGFPYDRATDPDNNLNYFCQLVPKIGGISRSGSAAFDLCNVACGRINGYWEFKLSPWDVAAGALIVAEAGGTVDYIAGKKGIALIAGNQSISGLIYQELRQVNPKLELIC
ncbi:MAG TPA: inositol monophosphatase family protein [Bacillota bacterium]|nr:inositol monophosphatase family protein [Bacillota bacterium]